MNRTLLLAFVTILLALWAYLAAGMPAALWFTGVGAVLLVLTDIDARTGYLPDYLTLPLLAAGLVIAPWALGIGWVASFAGAAGGAAFGLAVIVLSTKLMGKPGWGGGDMKLLAALGAWVGVAGLLPVILFSSCLGVAWLSWCRLVRGKRVKKLPFGPFLALGGWLVLLYQPLFWTWLLG